MSQTKKLIYKHRLVSSLSEKEREEMWNLYSQYYEATSYLCFHEDLQKKTWVILLYEKKSHLLKGFSTQLLTELILNGKVRRVLFSGDTVIEENFWGQGMLQWAFTVLMLKLKLQRPFEPLYWFLLSKGYKTYLLLANYFKYFWPRYDQSTPQSIQAMMDEYAKRHFYPHYIPQEGLLVFPEGSHERLKSGVAELKPQDLTNPHIQYFLKRNSQWQRGNELVCLGEFDLAFAPRVFFKTLLKNF